MGLFQKLKSALGLDGASSSDSGRSGDVDVTVEREPSTEDEDAVKGTDTATTDAGTDDEHVAETTMDADTTDVGSGVSDSPAADTVSAETADAEAAAVEDATDADETIAAGDSAIDEVGDGDSAVDESEADDTTVEEAETDAVEGSSDPVTELNGIGPAYAERLSGQGIETVGELAVADADAIAAETDLGAKRVSDWIAQAREY